MAPLGFALAVTALSLFVAAGPAERQRERAPAQASPYTPTDQYERKQIEGWTVLVNRRLLADQPDLARESLELLGHQLYGITRRIPAGPLAKIRGVRLWVELDQPTTVCMTYHPNPAWLREHGLNPDKAKCVELGNVRNFLKWTREQPFMVLHELSHAYHDQFLEGGFRNAEIVAAHRRGVESKRYDSVLRINGKDDRAYALTNPMEFFAEQSEAFLGTNDFYPFVTSELERHDPETHALLRKLWQVP